MSDLINIYKKIKTAPTIMGIKLEKEICEQLVSLDKSELTNQWDFLDKIFDDLYTSHTDSFYEIKSEGEFDFFISWLNCLANSQDFSQHKTELEDLADMFSVVP